MPNKDGIVSIGFDYKKDLEKMIKDFEAEMNTVSSNTQLSKGMKKQFDNILAEMREFKASMDKELANLGSGKVSQSSFKSFKQTVENKFKGIREDIDRLDLAVATLNDSMGILGKGVDLSKISNDFKNFEDYVTRTNSAVENLIHTLGEQGISLFSFDNRNISDVQSTIRKIDNELKQLDKDTGAEFELFNEKQAQDKLNRLSVQLTSTLELMENAKKRMESMDASTEGFKKARGEFALLQLKAASLNDTIEMLYEVTESKGMYIEMDDKSLSIYEKYTDELADNLEMITSYAKNAKKELSSLLDTQKAPAIKVSSEMNPNSSELATVVTIDTTSSELWKKLSPIMQDLQGILNSNPVIAPVKLVVAPTAVSSVETGNLDISNSYSKKYAKVLAQTGEDAVVDLEGVYKKTFTSVMDTAVSYAKETIGKIQEIFDKNLIGVKFDISQEEIDKIQNFVLSNKDGKKVDISGQITKTKQEVEELNENIEKTAKLLDDTKSKGNVKFDGFDKFTQDVSKSIGKLEELQNILKALQNIEITLAKASGIASITELDNQWAAVEKRIINATKLDGSFRKNASIGKIASEYQKYIDMGGTNSIADIDKIKDSKSTINTIISKAKEFAKQDLSNDSVKELPVELDGVIGKFDELIITVKTATNALYKIIKQTGVSELDKQWSSITNKFKSFVDESGKINLSKQKKDVEELLVMYQRYVNMGGNHTPFDLTDNLETIAKLDKVYKKLNETKPIDNSSTIKSETESFKQVEQSVKSLTKAIGDTKVQAINVEATAMEDAAEREILAINAIVDNLNMIVSKLKEIKGIKIPKIQVESATSTSPVETNISSGNSDKINNESVDAGYISDTKNNIIKWYRTVNDTITGLFSKGRTGSFFSDNLELSRGYADYNAKTYEAAIKLTDKLLELNGKGKANWDSLSYLGFGTDEDSKEIIELANQFQKIYGNINNLKKDGDSLFGSNSFFAISSEAKKGIESAKSIEDVVEQFKQIQQLSKMGLMPNSLPDFDLTDENDVKRLENILQDFYNIEKVVKRIKEINMDVNNLYGMTLPEEYYNNHVNANDDSARLTTNRMTDKASKAGYDAVLFKDIHDSAKEETGRIVSSILSVINNSIVDKVNVLSNDEIDKRLGNDFLEHIVQNTDEFQNNIQKSLREVLTSYMGAGEDISKEIDNIIKNVMSGYKGHIAEELHTEVNSFDDLLDRISREITKSTIDEYIPGKSITQEFKAQMTETYEEIVRGINQSMQSSTPPIEDTIQGDKIEQATTSAKELDKTLEQVNVPKESFDDVIAKFNIIEDKAKNIVKITKDMHRDSDGKPIESYNITYKDGSNESYGENSNPQLLRGKDVLYDSKQTEKEAKELLAVEKQITKEIEKQEKAQASAQKKKWQAFENEQKKYVSDQKKTTDIEKNKSAYQELLDTIKQYSEVSKRIAKNETLDGDLELAQKLENKISELQKQPILSPSQVAKSERELVNLYNQLDVLERKTAKQDKQSTQSKVDKALVSQLSAWKSIHDIRRQIAETDEKDTAKLQALNEEKKGYWKQYREAEKVLKANEDLYDKESQLAKLEHTRLETNEKINKIKLNNVDVGNVLTKGDSDLKKFEARKNQSEEYRSTVEKLKQSIEELRVLEQSMVKSKLLPDGEAQKINKAIASIEEYTDAIKNMPAVEKGSDEGTRTKWANRIQEYMDKNTRLTREFREELEGLIKTLRTGGDSVNIKNIIGQFEDAKFRIKEAKLEGKSFFDIFKDKALYGFAAKLANYYLSFYDFIRYGRNAVNVVVELNTQMINLSKVSEQTVAQISKDFSSYAKTAKEVGATISDTISATTNWAKNGYNIPDSQELAKVALIYKNVGDIDIESANESLISTIRGFKLEAEDAMHVIDVFNEVSNNEAISAGGIGEALKRSAASFSAANTSLEQSVALITATNSVLQDEEKTGNMWRTVSARIRGAKTELEEAGLETEGMVESTSKLQGLIKGMTGFDILEEDGKTFKDIFDIVLNIGEEFQNLSDIDQASLLEALAGGVILPENMETYLMNIFNCKVNLKLYATI